MAGPGQIANAGLGLLPGLLSGITNQNAQQWYQDALVNVLNNLNTANSYGWQYGRSQFDPASASAQQLLSVAPQLLFGANGGPGDINVLRDALQGSIGGISPSTFQQFASNPQMASALQSIAGSAGSLSDPAALLSNVIANGGGSAPSQQIFNALQALTQNRGATPLTSGLESAAGNAVGNGGMSPDLSKAMSTLQYIIDQGGSNPNMDQGVQTALGLLSGTSPYISQLASAANGGLVNHLGTPGLTSTGAAGERAALQGILANGATPTTNFFTQRGAQLAGQDAVLPTLLATSMARDEAARQVQNASTAARAQALAHGGGPGSTVANGTTNAALADFSDKAGGDIANAVENALYNQQGLNLQQQQNGASMGLQGGNLQAENLGINSNLLTQLENNATGRFSVGGNLLGNAQQLSTAQTGLGLNGLTGLSGLQSQNILQSLGLIPTTQNAGTNAANVFGNLGLNSGQLDLQTLLGGLGGMQGNLNQANNYTLGAAGALNNLTGTQGSLFNSIFGNNLNAGQLGLGQSTNFYNALNGLFNNQGNLVNNELGMSSTGLNGLLNIGNAGFNYANTALQGMPHIFSSYQPSNPFAHSFDGLSALGSAIFK